MSAKDLKNLGVETHTYQVVKSSGGILIHEGKILLVVNPRSDAYSIPKGSKKNGEKLRDAAIREFEEETGLTGVTIQKKLGKVVKLRKKEGRIKIIRFFLLSCSECTSLDIQDQGEYECQWVDWDTAIDHMHSKREMIFLMENRDLFGELD